MTKFDNAPPKLMKLYCDNEVSTHIAFKFDWHFIEEVLLKEITLFISYNDQLLTMSLRELSIEYFSNMLEFYNFLNQLEECWGSNYE